MAKPEPFQDIFECEVCVFEFEYMRVSTPKTICAECRRTKRRAASKTYYRDKLSQSDRPVVLPDNHPVLPVIAKTVHLLAAARFARHAIHIGRYDDAIEALDQVI
jgi:hypothetical protein